MTYLFSNEASLVIYIVIFTISSLLYLHKDRIYLGATKAQWINVLFVVSIPVLFAAARCKGGADLHVYIGGLHEYDNISIIDYLRNADIISGEPIGMVIVKKLSNGSPMVFLGILALLTYVPIVYTLMKKWKELPNSVLAMSVFFYMMNNYSSSFNIIKQSIAISFVFCSLIFVYDRKPFKFILTILCALLFHQTALVVIPVYFMWNEKNNVSTNKKVISFLGTIAVIFGLNAILEFVGGDWMDYMASRGTDNKIFYIYLFWMVVFLIFYRDLVTLDKRNELLILLYCMGTILNVIGFWSVFGKRIALYFTITQFLLMGQLPYCRRLRKIRTFMCLCLVAYTILIFMYLYYVLGHSGIIPYGVSI